MGENNDKEINVREVFAAIGRFISSIFYGLGSVFLQIFFFLIKSRKLTGIFGVIGIIAGIIYSNTGRPYYESTILLKSHDNDLDKSILNKILTELNNMCNAGDYNELALTLNIPVDKAKELISFKLLSVNNFDNTEYNFNKLLTELKGEEDEKKKEELISKFMTPSKDYVYSILVSSHNPDVLPMISEPFLKLLDSNPFFIRKREINKDALEMTERIIYEELVKLDSLKKTLTIAIGTNEIDTKRGSSNIFMGETHLYNPLPVYDKYLSLYGSAIETRKKISENERTIEVMSGLVKITKNARPSFVFAGFTGMGMGLLFGIFLAICIQTLKYVSILIKTKNL